MKRHIKIFLGLISDLLFLPLILLSLFILKLAKKFYSNTRPTPSIFMGTMPINNWVTIRDGLKKRGFDTIFLVHRVPKHEKNIINYDTLKLIKFMPSYLQEYFIFIWANYRYDLFIMPFKGRILDRHVLLNWLELPLLKKMNKLIILNSYGGDVMTPKMTLSSKNYKYSIIEGYEKSPNYSKVDENYIARNRDYCEKWADHIISALDQVEYLTQVDSYFHMRCIDTGSIKPVFDIDNDKIKILHATNHRELKGTNYLIESVNILEKEGIEIDLVILEGKPHSEVIVLIKKSDIIADQFIIGAYGRFAIEAMAYGKPVLCYLRENLFDKNPIWRECPIVNANPDDLKEKLKELIINKNKRIEIGKKSRYYVEKYHSVEYVVGKLESIISELYGRNQKNN
ncbi:MAG: Glycosyl transferases group 1 [Candidatus Methanofastidiosum methylothiophilum]|jgi:glycosyltransferase involved in cell wall biosynthesis|uniref:Glycosyl transferases group 1 n=1 Tax=Candidatus Methanofastidiosum methylothiophilum TaxID=1705564 RepID=A0A150J9V0_9EURY|nr:MAG: Glycosyl transferases group 1 [Candidatus Methanofastidiosum methylthiophilus]KYC55930.1 MAG: Glycosyl transferases group 1 [Candidatus Methanofastidiosum methylthiophilus]KYC56700.1 MAG: Glycosyl transferases group 1 [Candidatus Methanofastidiosum methylthiophilus]OQC49864.1 MAG: Glycosyl transferases group 1 [Euryarchaeota archaeon ADurb.Bin023]